MNLSHINRKWRIVAYIVLMAAGGVMVTLGIITQELLDGVAPALAGALMIAGGGLAAANVPGAHDTPPTSEEASQLGADLMLAILRELERIRGSESGAVAEPEAYQGRHRLED